MRRPPLTARMRAARLAGCSPSAAGFPITRSRGFARPTNTRLSVTRPAAVVCASLVLPYTIFSRQASTSGSGLGNCGSMRRSARTTVRATR